MIGGRIVLILELAIDPPDRRQGDRGIGMGAGRLGLDPGERAIGAVRLQAVDGPCVPGR